MISSVLEAPRVGRKKLNLQRERLELRADREWIMRVLHQANRLGISLSAYIRSAVTRQVEADESNEPTKKTKG